MIPPVSIYQQNYGQLWNNNIPVQYQLPKFLQWGTWIFTALQWFHDLLFTNGYSDGSNAVNWVSGTNYAYGTRVVDIDYAVYECYNLAGIVADVVNPRNDPANWFKVLDNFVGARERAYYNGTKIMLEYILNRQFQVPPTALPWAGASHITQIWIGKRTSSITKFWLSNGGAGSLSSYMDNSGRFSKNFLGNAYGTFSANAFTVNVPVAVHTTIGNNQPPGVTADQAITALVQKYAQCNLLFNIVTY